MINVTIDNKAIQVPEGTTILKAARMAGIDIPTLCYFELDGMKFENKPGGCRVCMVEVTKDFNGKPRRNLAPACATDCVEGMEVLTASPRALNARRTVLELILSPQDRPRADPQRPPERLPPVREERRLRAAGPRRQDGYPRDPLQGRAEPL